MESKSQQKSVQNSTFDLAQIEKTNKAFNQHFPTTITQQTNYENRDSKQLINEEMIKKVAINFLEEFRSSLFKQNHQNGNENLNNQAEEDQDEEEDSNSFTLDSSSSQYESLNDDSDECSSNQSEISVFTFQGNISEKKQNILEENQNQSHLQQKILLQSGQKRMHQNHGNTNRKKKKQNEIVKLKKRLHKKIVLGKKSQGPKINHQILKKFIGNQNSSQMKKETNKTKDQKGVRKLQKMIEKLQLDDQKQKQKFQQHSQERQDESSESSQQGYYDDIFLDWEDLFEKNQNAENNQNQPSQLVEIPSITKAIKKIKRDDGDENTLRFHFQLDVTDLITGFIKQKQQRLDHIQHTLEAIKQLENIDQPQVQQTYSYQENN